MPGLPSQWHPSSHVVAAALSLPRIRARMPLERRLRIDMAALRQWRHLGCSRALRHAHAVNCQRRPGFAQLLLSAQARPDPATRPCHRPHPPTRLRLCLRSGTRASLSLTPSRSSQRRDGPLHGSWQASAPPCAPHSLGPAESQNLASTRWVLAIKSREGGARRHKARLVTRGFKGQEKANATRDAPTASPASQSIARADKLSALAQKQWGVSSWGYAAAFLKGLRLEREALIAPPRGLLGPSAVWRLKRPASGLASAPKAWPDRLCEVAASCGFSALRLMDQQGAIIGMLALHVDDAVAE